MAFSLFGVYPFGGGPGGLGRSANRYGGVSGVPAVAADPSAGGWQPFDPRSAALSSLGQGLTGLGAGLLAGRNWGDGLSRGLLAANQGLQQGLQDARRDHDADQQGRALQRRLQREDRAAEQADAEDQRKAAALEAAAARPPAGVDPQQWHAWVMANPDAAIAGAVGSAFATPRPAPTPAAAAAPAGQYPKDRPARPADQAAFEALPVGAWFVNPADGQLMQKAR
jgi:hypothetical protein